MSAARAPVSEPQAEKAQRRLRELRPTDLMRRRARQSLRALVAIVILSQPVGPSLDAWAVTRLQDGADIGAQWAHYRSEPIPDVLFIGPSNARTDVDTVEISRLLSQRRGRVIRVGKLGATAESPAFMDALLYRVLELPKRPSMIVISVAAPLFNRGFRCPRCLKRLLAVDLFQISQPYDATFMARAWSLAGEERDLLALAWFLPTIAGVPVVTAAARCDLTDAGRWLARKVRPTVPLFLSAPTPCELGAHPSSTDQWAQTDEQIRLGLEEQYQTEVMHDYSFSTDQANHLMTMVGMTRASGATVSFLQYPHYWLEDLAPQGEQIFQAHIRDLAADVGVPMFNFSTRLRSDESLWADPLHLNGRGATALAPMLADSVDEVWR